MRALRCYYYSSKDISHEHFIVMIFPCLKYKFDDQKCCHINNHFHEYSCFCGAVYKTYTRKLDHIQSLYFSLCCRLNYYVYASREGIHTHISLNKNLYINIKKIYISYFKEHLKKFKTESSGGHAAINMYILYRLGYVIKYIYFLHEFYYIYDNFSFKGSFLTVYYCCNISYRFKKSTRYILICEIIN